MIRATTGGVMKTYRYNLMNSFINQNNAMNTVLTQRTFNSFAEDPASAAKAFRLRKSRMTVNSQLSICTDTMKKYETAYGSLQSINDVLQTKDGQYGEYMKTLKGTTLSWLNDPTGDAREQLNKVLDQLSELLVQNMNQKYGDDFIFAGADGHNVPFEVRDVNGQKKLFYRDVAVDSAVPDVFMDNAQGKSLPLAFDETPNGNQATIGGGSYIKMDTSALISRTDHEARVAAALPKVLMDSSSNQIMTFDQNGDPDPAGSYYLKIDPSDLITKTAYDNLDTIDQPDVLKFDPPNNGIMTFNANGEPDPDGFFYLKMDPSDLISKTDYEADCEAIAEKAQSTLLFSELGSPNEIMTFNEKGEPDAAGTYYLDMSKVETMTTQEYEAEKLEAAKLKYLATETRFVDIGLGFQEDNNGKLIESSGFDAALNGINYLGYGLDEDGDPKNLYSLVQQMKEISDSVPEGGSWDNVWPEFDRLVGKFETACSNFTTEFTNLAASTTKLENNEELLSDNKFNLSQQYSGIEDVDEVEAICAFLWAQYAYNSALKVGNSVLSQSLMDYLN